MPQTLTVLLLEDHWSVSKTISEYLSKHDMVVETADCLQAALAAAEANSPDVAVLDIVVPERSGQMPGFDRHTGVEAARLLRQRHPRIGVVFYSGYADRGPEVVQLATESQGRIVYLLKGSKPEELLGAIHKVASGSAPLDLRDGVQIVRRTAFDLAVETLSAEERAVVELALERLRTLSEPERRVFAAVGACRTHKQAADELGLSPKTVSGHLEAIYEKLGLREAQPGLNQAMILAKLHVIESLRRANSV